ncbi:hypothetical protein ACMC9I_01620 [Deinococcota bacterium DY0809b]
MRHPLVWTGLVALLLAACGPGGGGGGGGGPTVCSLSGSIAGSVTLDPTNCDPYRVTDDLTVEDGGRLVIQPGTTLEFAQDTGLYVRGHGALVAVGTASDKILFTGASQVRGYWNGIVFEQDANSFDNELKYAEIAYAGADQRWSGTSYGYYRAALDLQARARLKMTYSTVRESAGSGVYVDRATFGADDLRDGDFAHNTLTQNAGFPVLLYANEVGFLDASSDFSGNDAGYDYVRLSGSYDYVQTQTWQKLNVPYRVLGEVSVDDQQTLTIAPGATLVFEQDAALWAYGVNSALKAVGTAAEPITFTALQPQKGYWYGLVFNDTNSADNVLHYVVVEYGGAETNPELKANIAVISSGNASSQWIEIKNSTIQHSSGHGISVAQETTYNADITTSNSFADIDGDDFHVQP